MSANITYVILSENQQNSTIGDTLNASPVVSQVVFQNGSHQLGGRHIPDTQIRDFRAERLETGVAPRKNVSAYVTNIPESPMSDEGASLQSVLRGAIPRYTQEQLEHLERVLGSPEAVRENEVLNDAIGAGIENLVRATNESSDYAVLVHLVISNSNTNISSDLVHTDSGMLFFAQGMQEGPHSQFLASHVQAAFSQLANLPLAARIFNIFLSLGLPFMDYVYNRYNDLANGIDTEPGSLQSTVASGWSRRSQFFLIRLRQALSGLFILFIGLEHYVSIDLGVFIQSMRTATMSTGLVISSVRGYQILNHVPPLPPSIEAATANVNRSIVTNRNSYWARLRTYYSAYISPIMALLRINPTIAMSTIASVMYLLHMLQTSGGTPMLASMDSMLTRGGFGMRVGPITHFFNELPLAIRDFLRRFRKL